MPKDMGLSDLFAAFRDTTQHIAIGKITKLGLASDRSVLRAEVQLFTDDLREIVARVTWDAVGPNAGSGRFPQVDDLAILVFADRDMDQAFILRYMSSKVDLIPSKMADGHSVNQALTGKKNYVASDTAILLGLPDSDPTEPLVLGNVALAALTNIIQRIDDALDAIASGPVAVSSAPGQPAPTHPALASALQGIRSALAGDKSTYVTAPSTNIVSQLSFTERGGA